MCVLISAHHAWFPDKTVEAAKNYCRNPSFWSDDRPWCYTLHTKRFDYCDIPACPGRGVDYFVLVTQGACIDIYLKFILKQSIIYYYCCQNETKTIFHSMLFCIYIKFYITWTTPQKFKLNFRLTPRVHINW